MPNQRKKGSKLAGAYIESEKDKALEKLAKQKGYPDKASFIRAIYDAVIAAGGTLPLLIAAFHAIRSGSDWSAGACLGTLQAIGSYLLGRAA